MKKVMNWALMLVTILSTGLTFSSCDADDWTATELSGQWEGDFGMYYVDEYNRTWDADYSVIDFYQKLFSNHGTGYQYDHYSHGPYKYRVFRFNWSVENGTIHLEYPSDKNLNVSIYDYRMSSTYFEGYFENTGSSFYLEKYTDDMGWDSYGSGNYYYGYNDGYDYAKTRSLGDESTQEVKIIKSGNRLNEK